MLVILFCVAMMQSLTAQKTLTVKKVKQISSSKAAKISQTQFQMKEKIKFVKMLDGELFVSQRFERTLQDNGTYIDERGYHQMTFDIIKKTNGDFALVYAASTENLDIYSKGIIFTLAPDLTQRGNAMIITRNDEELRSLKLNESFNGGLSIAYTCNDNSCVNNIGQRNNSLTALKFVSVATNGQLSSRNIDNAIGDIQLKGMFNPPGSNDITVAYNLDGIGKLGLAGMYLGASTLTCGLRQLATVETKFYGQSSLLTPSIKSISLMGNKFLILHNEEFKAPEWDLASQGLTSGRVESAVWPLLVVDGMAVANNSNSTCGYDNDPYTIYSDGLLQLQNILQSIPLSDGMLGVIEQVGVNTYFNVFNSQLSRMYQHIALQANIHLPSIQVYEIVNNRILFFYKTKSGSDIMEYRVSIYDWNTDVLIKDGSEILWQNVENFQWDNVHKLVRIDENNFVAVTFMPTQQNYLNQQKLEYRILTLNLKE